MKIIVSLLVIVLSTIIGVWVLSVGWGLTPRNWGVIIFGALLNFVLVGIMGFANEQRR